MTNLPVSLSFEGIELTIIDHEGRPWLSAADLARALGYADTRSLSKIYARNEDEFTPDMTEVVKMATSGNYQTNTRIFSPRGCHLVAMLAKTAKAKAFRKWVLDVLDGVSFRTDAPLEPITPKQFQVIRRRVQRISTNFHYRYAAEWAVYKRLRDDLNAKSAKTISASQYDAAIKLLDHMEEAALEFKSVVYCAEQIFFREIFRMGKDFNPAEIRKLLDHQY